MLPYCAQVEVMCPICLCKPQNDTIIQLSFVGEGKGHICVIYSDYWIMNKIYTALLAKYSILTGFKNIELTTSK